MNDVEFERRASEVLDALFEQVEEQLGDWLEVDMTGGVLQIELPDGGTYVINKHGPNREIWLSSPKSGAWHFALAEGDDGETWRSTRAGPGGHPELVPLLTEELAEAAGRPVALEL